mmetsp:Transcript_90201/g.263789  ORF Transcript_90201/g.263789 Transcript_90201/m.263789 type:complete len:542 (+) Transcript_90201:68-1693(+)
MPRILWLLQLLAPAHRAAVASASTAGGSGSEDETCEAGRGCAGQPGSASEAYHWPTAHGHWRHYGTSPHVGPFNLSASLAWSWQVPDGQYHDMPLGAAIDDQKNIYVSADQAVWKLSPEGKTLWKWSPPLLPGQPKNNLIPNGASIYEGAVFIDTTDGRFFSIDMETGRQIWVSKVSNNACTDTGFVAVYGGVAVAEIDGPNQYGLCSAVVGVNTTDGSRLWSYTTDNPLWDLMVHFLADGTFVFQDVNGKAYRNHLLNGTNIWKNGGEPAPSWTDGTQGVGPNGIIYTVSIQANHPACAGGPRAGAATSGPDCPGWLRAYRLSDGEQLWQKAVPRPPNSSPVVGRLGAGDRLSVVIPVGQQPSCDPPVVMLWYWFPSIMNRLPGSLAMLIGYLGVKLTERVNDAWHQRIWGNPDLPSDVYAFDAETGDFQWRWTGPTYKRFMCPGDEKGYIERSALGIRSASCPTPWSAPRIGADGTIYVGNMNGIFYAIKDLDGNGQIDPDREVSSFDCEAEFSSIGSAHAPGLMVIASGVKVWAFKAP